MTVKRQVGLPKWATTSNTGGGVDTKSFLNGSLKKY
jgi:hypothetical protein